MFIFFVKFCSTLKLILDPPLISVVAHGYHTFFYVRNAIKKLTIKLKMKKTKELKFSKKVIQKIKEIIKIE